MTDEDTNRKKERSTRGSQQEVRSRRKRERDNDTIIKAARTGEIFIGIVIDLKPSRTKKRPRGVKAFGPHSHVCVRLFGRRGWLGFFVLQILSPTIMRMGKDQRDTKSSTNQKEKRKKMSNRIEYTEVCYVQQ
jgi:hypothetical protein